jgi:hypothetical protein
LDRALPSPPTATVDVEQGVGGNLELTEQHDGSVQVALAADRQQRNPTLGEIQVPLGSCRCQHRPVLVSLEQHHAVGEEALTHRRLDHRAKPRP